MVKRLPWVAIRDATYTFRRVFATKDRPNRNHISVEESAEDVVSEIKNSHFRTGWPFSYHYEGEDYNLSRPEYDYAKDTEMQLHIRVFENDDGACEIFTHYEVCPVAHPRQHLSGKYHDVDQGISMTTDILDDKGYEYSIIEV